MSNLNLAQFYGLGGVPIVEALVEYMKEKWGLNSQFAPLAALVLGIGLNLLLGFFLGNNLQSSLEVGVVTALASNLYHNITTK